MTMTDLGVECMVGLCMAAAIWWVARRRCRTHTEEPKTRFESVDSAKAMSLVDDASAAAPEEDALLAEGDDASECSHDRTDAKEDVVASPHSQIGHHQQPREQEEEDADEEEEDDAAETDVTDHDEEEEDEEDEGEEEEVQIDDQMKEALARAEAMAAKMMGVSNAFGNMTESVMAMEEFLVLDSPLSPAQPDTEAERMQLEDPAASVEAHLVEDDANEDAGEEEDEDEDRDLVNIEIEEERDDDEKEAMLPAAAADAALAAMPEGETSGVMSSFWAQCENKDECSLCNTSFSFLVRRHHCRKCRASVCGGCSSNSAALAEFGGSVERVCDRCWTTMQMVAADHDDDDERGGEAQQQDEEKTLSS